MNLIKKIELFGDSILKGVVLEAGKYSIKHNLGVEEISKIYKLDISNNSKFGCTISKGFEIIKKNVGNGTICDAAVLEYGGNDCNFDWKLVSDAPQAEHEPFTPIKQFAEIYEKIIIYLKENNITAVLTSLPPISSPKFLNWVCRNGIDKDKVIEWLGDENAIYRYHESYSREVEKLAIKYNCPCVDIRGAFLARRKSDDLICEDGMHPTEEGQIVIHDAFQKFLEEYKFEKAV